MPKNTHLRMLRLVFVMLLASSISACFSFGSKDDVDESSPHYYIIDVDRGAVANQFPQDKVLLLKPVRVTSHYRSTSLVFRVGENEYQAQENHQFFSQPEQMFTEQLRRWLEKSGQFTLVTTDENAPADMVLDAAVTALYGDNREQFSPQAVLEMQFFLTTNNDGQTQPLFQTGLNIEVDIEETTAANVVKGWKQGLEEMLATLEDDFSGYFSKRSP